MNKAKPSHLKGKVILINAETMFTKLKKSLNKKNCKVSEQDRKEIVKQLVDAVDTDVCKLVSVDQLMYNKVDIEITRQDENGKAVDETKKLEKVFQIIGSVDNENESFVDLSVNGDGKLIRTAIKENGITNIVTLSEVELKQRFTDCEKITVSHMPNGSNDGVEYVYFKEDNIIQKNGVNLGKGILNVKLTKPKKSGNGEFKVEVSIDPLKEKDSEITSFNSDLEKNDIIINEFLSKWVKEPNKILEKKEGCEINFNKAFPKKVEIRRSQDILAELSKLDKEFGEI